MRMPFMKHLTWYLIIAMFIIGIAPKVDAGFAPSEIIALSQGERTVDLQKIQNILEVKAVKERLSPLGLTHDEIQSKLSLSNYFLQEPQIALAELLVLHSGYPKVFFANSGTEAVEGAIKIARRWGSSRAKQGLVSFSHAFHGRTMGALSLMDRPNYLNGFGPFLDHCTVAEFDRIDSLRAAVTPGTAAVVLEFIQGEGGIRPVSPGFVAGLKELQSTFGFLIIADEIQTGIGRTGRFLGFQHYDIRPDLVTLAKPIGGGLPLGAILATEALAAVIEPGMHGTTFGGNPVACAAGAAVIREVTVHTSILLAP